MWFSFLRFLLKSFLGLLIFCKTNFLTFVYDGLFALVVVLFQVVSTCLKLFSVFQIFLVVLACVLKLFPMFLISSCVFQLDFDREKLWSVFRVVLPCSWLFCNVFW